MHSKSCTVRSACGLLLLRLLDVSLYGPVLAQSDMIERDEAQYIQQATATLKQHTGTAPKGWLSPWISESHVTLDLLQVITLSTACEHATLCTQHHVTSDAQQVLPTTLKVVMQSMCVSNRVSTQMMYVSRLLMPAAIFMSGDAAAWGVA